MANGDFSSFLEKLKRHLCICRQRNLSISNTSQDSSRVIANKANKDFIFFFRGQLDLEKRVSTWLRVNHNSNDSPSLLNHGDHEILFYFRLEVDLPLISPLTRPSQEAQERPHHGGRLHEDMAAMLRLFWS